MVFFTRFLLLLINVLTDLVLVLGTLVIQVLAESLVVIVVDLHHVIHKFVLIPSLAAFFEAHAIAKAFVTLSLYLGVVFLLKLEFSLFINEIGLNYLAKVEIEVDAHDDWDALDCCVHNIFKNYVQGYYHYEQKVLYSPGLDSDVPIRLTSFQLLAAHA